MAAPLTPARAALLRSNAGRSGYPIPIGVKAWLYALSNVMRSGASRSNYHSGAVYITIGGIQVGGARPNLDHRILVRSLAIRDGLDSVPSTAHATAVGFVPVAGQRVVVALGSTHGAREFAGTILRTNHGAITSDASVDSVDFACIDDTWGLDTRKVSEYYTGSASTIAAALLATYAPGYTADIAPGLPTLSGGITFTNANLTDCLTQLCKRIGSSWTCDYFKIVHLPADRGGESPPTEITAIHPTLRDFTHDRDLSQTVTRVHVEGGGVVAAATVPPGETILPLEGDPAWYDPAGGTVVSGPQRVTYTGVSASAGGGLVGTGAGPSGAPVLTLAGGAGLAPGAHSYAVTFATAVGESIAGPVSTITTGALAAPPTAPTAGTPTPGSGPNAGSHDYAVSFLTAAGETVPGPRVTQATAETAAPQTALVPDPPEAGTGPDPGSHEYAVSFTTAVGETLVGPISAGVLTGFTTAPGPTAAPTLALAAGAGVEAGAHSYAVTFTTSAGETVPGPEAGGTIATVAYPPLGSGPAGMATTGGSIPSPASYAYYVSFLTAGGGETEGGGGSPAISLLGPPYNHNAVDLTQIPVSPDPRVTGRKIYRTTSSASAATHVLTINDNTTTTAKDTAAAGTTLIPSTNTTGPANVALSALPIGPPGTTGRKIYRRSGGAGLRLVTAIGNNSTTTYTDATPSASLGAAPPTVGASAPAQVVPLTAIPTGPTGAGITGRKVYRRSGGAGLRFLTTIANNTTTSYTDTTPNAGLGAAPPAATTAFVNRIPLANLPIATSPLVTSRRLYGTAVGNATLRLVATLNLTDTTYLVTTPDASLGAAAPSVTTAVANQVQLSSIPIGAPSVTARKLYRTPTGGGPLYLLTTIAGNVTTTYLDAAADAALGGLAPVSDTSGLTQPQGNVVAGSTSLVVANIGAFPPAGWAVIGNGTQVIRYTGVSGNVLTGIPATGPGSIQASIAFNSTVTSAPVLTGIPASGPGAIRYPILKGDDVNLWVTANDLEAQAARAALLGGDGVQEEYLQDRRLARAEASARAAAVLALKRLPIETVRYTCRDTNTRAGRLILVNLGPPYNVYKVPLRIQSVTETFAATASPRPPLYTVEASSVRYTFEQLVAMIR